MTEGRDSPFNRFFTYLGRDPVNIMEVLKEKPLTLKQAGKSLGKFVALQKQRREVFDPLDPWLQNAESKEHSDQEFAVIGTDVLFRVMTVTSYLACCSPAETGLACKNMILC